MLISLQIFTDKSIYTLLSERANTILDILFGEHLPPMNVVRQEHYQSRDIRRVYYDDLSGFTRVELYDGTSFLSTESVEQIQEKVNEYCFEEYAANPGFLIGEEDDDDDENELH